MGANDIPRADPHPARYARRPPLRGGMEQAAHARDCCRESTGNEK